VIVKAIEGPPSEARGFGCVRNPNVQMDATTKNRAKETFPGPIEEREVRGLSLSRIGRITWSYSTSELHLDPIL
jgi:hypothetical protein